MSLLRCQLSDELETRSHKTPHDFVYHARNYLLYNLMFRDIMLKLYIVWHECKDVTKERCMHSKQRIETAWLVESAELVQLRTMFRYAAVVLTDPCMQ